MHYAANNSKIESSRSQEEVRKEVANMSVQNTMVVTI